MSNGSAEPLSKRLPVTTINTGETSMPHQSTPETPIFELAEELIESWRGITKYTAGFLRALGEFDRRRGYEDWGYVDTAQWLDAECGISRVTAREKVRVARGTRGTGEDRRSLRRW